jgi:L-aminopeptidase/D-esterase-like protein
LKDGGQGHIVGAMVERKDVEAALAARHELGRAYEPEIVDSMVEKIERRLAERPPAAPVQATRHRGSFTPLALGSIGAGVGATAIATVHQQGWVAVVAWIAIVLVNFAATFRR